MTSTAPVWGKRLEQLEVGEALGPCELIVSKQQTREYALFCGLKSGRFHDDEEARREGLPGMIAPGNLSLGLLSKLVTDWLGSAGGRLARIGTTYRAPLLADHRITLHGFVTHTDAASGRADIDLWIEDKDAERLVIGTATVEFPCTS